MKKQFFIFLLLFTACQQKKPAIIKISIEDSFRNSLIGKWGGLNESHPVWKISHDSVYYYSQNKSYPYSIAGNDLIIDEGLEQPLLKNVSVIKDTLFFYSIVSTEEEIYQVVRSFRYN
jgi:hypothetical protein